MREVVMAIARPLEVDNAENIQNIQNIQNIDKVVLGKLKRLALDSEIRQTNIKQLELKISIAKDSPSLESKDLESLESNLNNLKNSDETLQEIQILTSQAKNYILCIAAYHGLYLTVEYLLDNEVPTTAVIAESEIPADLNKQIPWFFSDTGVNIIGILSCDAFYFNRYPLQLALDNKQALTAELLVRRLANVDAIYHNNSKINNRTGLFSSNLPPTLIYCAAEKGDIFSVKFLLAKGAAKDTCDKYGRSPLYLAAYCGHNEVVTELLTASADPTLRMNGKNRWTAADAAKIPEIKYLIEAYIMPKIIVNALQLVR